MKLRFLLLLSICMVIGISACTIIKGQKFGEGAEINTQSAGWLINNPVYDKEIMVWGKVSGLDEMYCPCFQIESAGGVIEVWYDLMINDQGKSFPKADTGKVKNGDMIVIKGEMVSEKEMKNGFVFWMKEVTKIEASESDSLIISATTCQDECLKMGLAEGICKSQDQAETDEIKIGSCEPSESGQCSDSKNCGCFCRIQDEQILTAAPPAVIFLFEQLRLKSGLNFPHAQAIEMRYQAPDSHESPIRWLKAAETVIVGNVEALKSLETAFDQLGVRLKEGKSPQSEMENVSLRQRDNIICMIIAQGLENPVGSIEVQCGIL